MPKILLLGKTQNGKSTLLINMSNPGLQKETEKLKYKVSIGDGVHSCTSEISFHLVTLRQTQARVIVIDAPGLDDGRDANQDERIMVLIFEKLNKIKNINCVLILVKRGEIMG